MKTSPEIYHSIKTDIATLTRVLGIDLTRAPEGKSGLMTMYDLLGKVSFDRAYPDTHPGFASGRVKRVLPWDGREYCFYYAGGCNDTHLATALRKIKGELIKEA